MHRKVEAIPQQLGIFSITKSRFLSRVSSLTLKKDRFKKKGIQIDLKGNGSQVPKLGFWRHQESQTAFKLPQIICG